MIFENFKLIIIFVKSVYNEMDPKNLMTTVILKDLRCKSSSVFY